MAPASKRTPLSDASDSDDDDIDDDDSENGQNGVATENIEEVVPEIKLDVSKLHPLSPEVIQKQATINIGQFATDARNGLAVRMAMQSCTLS